MVHRWCEYGIKKRSQKPKTWMARIRPIRESEVKHKESEGDVDGYRRKVTAPDGRSLASPGCWAECQSHCIQEPTIQA